MISLRSVSKSYGGVRALTDLDLELESGEIFGYIGPNGAGKTTTIKILTGLIRDYRGTVSIGGTDIRAEPELLHTRIGYLPQDVGFQEWRTVDHALQTLGLLSGIDRSSLPSAIDRALERTGIAEHRSQRIAHLSGGTVQKLRLAQAIMHDPDILILDEPLSGLDPASRFQVRQIITELAGRNRLVFVSSHILGEIEGIATRIGVLHAGRIREVGTPAELRSRYELGVTIEVVARPDARIDWRTVLPDYPAVESPQPEVARVQVDPTADLDDAIQSIIRRLLDASVPVRSVRHLQPSLEQVYLALVEEAAR